MSEFRRDPIIGRWVIISTERGKRPSDFPKEQDLNAGKPCPFCPGNEALTTPSIITYKNHKAPGHEWSLRVIPNKYPALAVEGAISRRADGMYDKMHGIGAHEIIIESPDHKKDLDELPNELVEDVFWAFRDRVWDLKRDNRLEYILMFKNRGSAAGSTLAHPHTQLIATPVVPKRVKEEIDGALKYFNYKDRCGFCDIVTEEITTAKRIVAENDDFIAFCPFASRFPFEMWVMPKVHSSHFEDIKRESVVHLASIMREVIGKTNSALGSPSYNFIVHNGPLKEGNMAHFHWHIEIMPKLTQVAGFEWGTGFYINPTPPEEAARFLRESE